MKSLYLQSTLLLTSLFYYQTTKAQQLLVPNLFKKELEYKAEDYKYIPYAEMRQKLYNLANLYPNLMKIETAEQRYGIPHEVECGNELCQIDIVTISDFEVQSDEKAQVYISGTLHGDEVIGPNTAYYLIEYLISSYKEDSLVTNLLRRREIIITPMTNSVGYNYNERAERINVKSENYKSNPYKRNKNTGTKEYYFEDINRDFPYNTDKDKCLNTIAGRVIHQIMVENVIVSAITFHGGINVIAYPWGSYNRLKYQGTQQISREAPDYQAFEGVGWIIKNETGAYISQQGQKPSIKEYIFGDISSTIYPVQGGLEDWGYGAGFDYENNEATVFECRPTSYLLQNVTQSKEAYQSVRTAVYIVETDESKRPDEKTLGSREVSHHRDGRFKISKESVHDQNSIFDGHINRNIRLALAIIDLSKPYIDIVSYKELENNQVELIWKVNGCHTLNQARTIINGVKEEMIEAGASTTCNYLLGREQKQHEFKVIFNQADDLVLEAVTDQHFGKSINPSDVSPPGFADNPQLHLSKLRLQENYQIKSSHGKSLKGNKYIRSTKEESNILVNILLEISGIYQLTQTGPYELTVNGQLSDLPLYMQLEIQIMEYGDLSSLAVEYPDYNSLGKSILSLYTIENFSINKESNKFSQKFEFPQNITKMSDLAGRAIAITQAKDLVAYGILANETKVGNDSNLYTLGKQANSVAVCENLLSAIHYRAVFQLQQKDDKVSFSGLLRTSTRMEDENELILSINYKQSFDLDFNSAYKHDLNEKDQYEEHPCYVLDHEQIENQDWIIGRDLMMYGQHESYNTKILETSKCHIGLQNPDFRISDERFCKTELDQSKIGHPLKKYTLTSLINGFIAGLSKLQDHQLITFLVCGLVLSFVLYLSQKMTWRSEEKDERKRLETAARMEFVELQETNQSQRNHYAERLDDDL
ncbi:zinc carboxypeptidase family protein [Stylonychia lemnae]|uniref:Zinc carboxypeptidase family protein n=1 Tax=Stylonychia lemnae TaxID=5949 RepID=A0A078ABE3_STYLE|nr:zinc carboxypeptidase family protein [Stylonychia lemnae]|eukprot:CDW79494.1 zinc carboxypeptidase family protein [Stylonychia lemnae]